MDKLIVQIAAQAGSAGIVAGLFLLYMYKRDQSGNGWKSLLERLARALDANTRAISKLADRLDDRSCLWQEEQQRMIEDATDALRRRDAG